MKNTRILLAITLALGFALSGCNTVQGVGKDVGQAGHAIQRAAQ